MNTGWCLTYPSEKYECKSVGSILPNILKNEKCSKPPTRISLGYNWEDQGDTSINQAIDGDNYYQSINCN
jgi:hypothetical protein